MTIDPGVVQRVAAGTGFNEQVIEQILHLKVVLKMIGEDPILSPRFVLIGGTAINLFSKKVPRLSVDIDLDYVHRGGKAFSHKDIENHLSVFQRIAGQLDMDFFDRRNTAEKSQERLRIILEYQSNFGHGSKIAD